MRSRRGSSAPSPGTDRAHGLRRWWLDRSLRSKGLIVITIPLLALFATTSASLVLQHSQSQDRAAGVNARDLTNAANLVLADMVNAETGVRGYAAVRDPLFLGPYNLTLARIGAERNSLREAAAVEGVGRQERAVDATTNQILADFAQLRPGRRAWRLAGAAPSGAGAAENDHGPAAPPDRQPHCRTDGLAVAQHNKRRQAGRRSLTSSTSPGWRWGCSPGWPVSPSSLRASPAESARTR